MHCGTRQSERDSLTTAREGLTEEVNARLKSERAALVKIEGERARAALADEIASRDREVHATKAALSALSTKLSEAQNAQAAFLRKERGELFGGETSSAKATAWQHWRKPSES